MRPPLPTSTPRLTPAKATPGGLEPFDPAFTGNPPPTEAPGSESGNTQYSPVFVTDDGDNFAPVDDDNTTAVGYQS